jgi:hypothetical protein
MSGDSFWDFNWLPDWAGGSSDAPTTPTTPSTPQITGVNRTPYQENPNTSNDTSFWGDKNNLGTILGTATKLGEGIFGQRVAQDNLKQSHDQAIELNNLNYQHDLELTKLKLAAASGEAGAKIKLAKQQALMAAYQNYAANTRQTSQDSLAALGNLGQSVSKGYLSTRR